MKKSYELNEEEQYYENHNKFYGWLLLIGMVFTATFIVIKEALSFKKTHK